LEATTLDARTEVAALKSALAPVPQVFGVAWFRGAKGSLLSAHHFTAAELRAELREALGVNAPKCEGRALLCAELTPEAKRRRREDIIAPSFVVVDQDHGARTLGEVLTRCEALGLAVVAGFPSVSERAGWRDARRWRLLLPIARPVAPSVYARGVGARLLRALAVALECELDSSCGTPERLTFVHPRTGIAGRIPDIDLRTVEGSALDIMAFCDAVGWRAEEGKWWQSAALARMVGGCGPEVLSIAREAGLAPSAPDARGWAGCRCPRAAWHTSKSGATSTGMHVESGAVRCSHTHSGAPEGERGPAGAARFLRWVAEDRPDLAGRIAAVRDRGLVAELRDALSRPPRGEEPRRVVARDEVAGVVADAMRLAVAEHAVVLLTPTVGAGKSFSAAAAMVSVVSNARATREGAEHTLASVGGVFHTLDARAEFAARLAPIAAEDWVGVGVHTPAHLIVQRDESPVCAHPELMRRVYLAGGAARASVCEGGVPTYPGSSTLGRCPNYDGCPARTPVVPWVSRGGSPGTPAVGAELPEVWAKVGTHAMARSMALRMGAALVVDESDTAFAPVTGRLGTAEIALAGQWAAVTLGRKGSEAPKVGRVLIEVLRGCPSAVTDVATGEREAWLRDALIASQPYDAHPWWRRVREWLELGADAPLGDVASAAVDAWRCKAGKLGTSGNAPPTGGASEAYRTAAQWAKGAPVVRCDRDGTPIVAWRSDASTLAASVCARGGGVLALDATGDVELTRAAVTPVKVLHLPVRVVGGAEVLRVLIASGTGGRGSLCSAHYTAGGVARKGAVHWRHLSEALASVSAALVVARRRGFGVGAGVVFAPRVVALTCEVLLTGREVRELAPKAGAQVWDAVNASVATAPEGTTEVLRAIGAERWTHYRGTLARGSNALRHLAWSVTLGDDRTPASTLRARNGALGLATDEAAIRAAADSGASRTHEQAHGRLRAVQRDGARLAMVHFGKVPPLDWYQMQPAAEVLTPSTVRALAAEPRRAEVLPLRRASSAPSTAPEPSPTSVEVRNAIAGGCSLGDVVAITGADTNTVRRWFAGETEPRDPKHLRALRDATDPNSPAGVRVTLRALMTGRGWAKVWPVVRAELAGCGFEASPAVGGALHRWAELPTARLPAGVLPAVVDVLPAVVRALGLAPRTLRAVARASAPETADGAA
jgi:hypothetical protein